MPANPDLMADLLWLQTCYYFGDHATSDRKYDYLDEYLELITALSPKWSYPYYFAGSIMANEVGDIDKSIAFLDRAIENFPEKWQFQFYKGVYLMMYSKDLKKAAEAIHKASMFSESPRYLKELSISLATRAGQKQLAYYYLKRSLKKTHDPAHKKILIEKFQKWFNDDYRPEME